MSEIQDIFIQCSEEFLSDNHVSFEQLKAINAIKNCRTDSLGGHIEICDTCGNVHVSYNSCRNRHCPKCQGIAREKWIYDRQQDILPIKYFHVVFTVPGELYPIFRMNQKLLYDILFKASSQTLLELSSDKKYIGAQIGFISVLHTWGQNLMFHPHIHCIVTGGGLSENENSWRNSKKNFFIPVKVLGKKFRGKFLCYLKDEYYANELKLYGDSHRLMDKFVFSDFIDSLFRKNWVVYCKKPFENENCVINYLGRYTHRVAISNSRIVDFKDKKVTFKWKDYKDNNKNKIMTLDASEFIRRFLLHILPKGFVKIRYYGLLSNRNRKLKLARCKNIFKIQIKGKEHRMSAAELFKILTGREIDSCRKCKQGKMIIICTFHPKKDNPPGKVQKFIG